MVCRVAPVTAEVSEERITSVIRVTRISELGTEARCGRITAVKTSNLSFMKRFEE
jgi:hypothetical protein